MKIGIPRAFLYYKYGPMWEAFFRALDCETVVSPETTKATVTRGAMLSIDETCLSSKIFMGHTEWLIGKCDRIFVPRISNLGRDGIMCTKFEALYDLVAATFRDSAPKLLDFDIDIKKGRGEMAAYMSLGEKLGAGRTASFRAYLSAKQTYEQKRSARAAETDALMRGGGTKILIVAHPYVLFDKYVGGPVVSFLSSLGAVPVAACDADSAESLDRYTDITNNLPWTMSRELVGAVARYYSCADGIILMSAFPCGPDSLVNDMIMRRVHDKPILTLTMDVQDGDAGVETRLESFMDIINMRRGER